MHEDINYRCDQCDFKDTQLHLNGWVPGFLITGMGYYKKNKENQHPSGEIRIFFTHLNIL